MPIGRVVPNAESGTLACSVGSLGVDDSATIPLVVTVTTPGTLQDAARVTASNVTADSDDTARATTTVNGS